MRQQQSLREVVENQLQRSVCRGKAITVVRRKSAGCLAGAAGQVRAKRDRGYRRALAVRRNKKRGLRCVCSPVNSATSFFSHARARNADNPVTFRSSFCRCCWIPHLSVTWSEHRECRFSPCDLPSSCHRTKLSLLCTTS